MAAPEALEVERPAALRGPSHRRAVEQVIEAMSERLDERFSLESLASLAFFSRYHFHRLFRQVTGVPPGRFFSALRIEAAKRMLLTSELSVTEICFAVGYQSVGTFTSQFTRLVGISPRRLRVLARSDGWAEITDLPAPRVDPAAQTAVSGYVDLPDGTEDAFAAIGLFPTRLAEGRPAGCTLVAVPGEYELETAHRGSFHVLAVSIDACGCWNDLLNDRNVHVAATAAPVRVCPGRPLRVDLSLRPRRVTDPPVLLAPTLLLGAASANDNRRIPEDAYTSLAAP